MVTDVGNSIPVVGEVVPALRSTTTGPELASRKSLDGYRMERSLVARGITAATPHFQIADATVFVEPNTDKHISVGVARSRDGSRQHAINQ